MNKFTEELRRLWRKTAHPRIIKYPEYLIKDHKGRIVIVVDLDYKPKI